MGQLLLVNPRKRTRRTRRNPAGKRVVRRNPLPAPVSALNGRKRRRNPIGMSRLAGATRSRRRNPIGGMSYGGVMGMLKTAAIGGAGSIAVDLAMGQIQSYLPASFQKTPGQVGVGDAVKIGITIALGQLLKGSTKGLSTKMAEGSLTVQMRDLLSTVVPATMPLGYASPARIVAGSARVGPNMSRMAAYTRGQTPVLNAYQRGGQSAMLNGALQRKPLSGARAREGFTVR